MSQNPLASIKRAEPRRRGAFPDDSYREHILDPLQVQVTQLLEAAAIDVYTAHTIMLAEQRIIEPETAAAILTALSAIPPDDAVAPQHPLSGLEARIVEASSAELLHARAQEEIALAAMRLVLRERALDLAEATLTARKAIAELALGNLTTLLLATANGQVVSPTSLGHYLSGQLGPLARTSMRLRAAYERLNQSPLGAVSGMATAMPVQRGRAAELLGFDRAVESTFDAIAGGDVIAELPTIVSLVAVESSRLVADLAYWARDDVGLLTPGDEFIHASNAQPQRRDPLLLDHLRARLAELAAAPAAIVALQLGQPMLGGEATRFTVFLTVERQLATATTTYELLAATLRSAVVHRALFAHRTNRGFATSSELADLLAIDFQLPRDQADALAQRIVIEATEQGIESTTLRPDLIDRIALREIGRELGIDPELLARCLSPKRFVERRDVVGGPAPRAVSAALDRESLAAQRERSWIEGQRSAIARAATTLCDRRAEIMLVPDAVLNRPIGPGRASDPESADDRIDTMDLT